MNVLMILWLIGGFLLAGESQPATISGIVTDRNTKATLTGVSVTLGNDSTSFKTITDKNGNYSIKAAQGEYSLSFQYFVNTDTILKNVKIDVSGAHVINVELIPNTSPVKIVPIIPENFPLTTDSSGFDFSAMEELPGDTVYYMSKCDSCGRYGIVSGRVLDINNSPIVGAAVSVEPSKRGSYIKDKNGFFIVKHIPAGNYNIKIHAVGFETKIIKALVKEDSSLFIQTHLSYAPIRTDEIEVTADKVIRKTETGSVMTLRTSGESGASAELSGFSSDIDFSEESVISKPDYKIKEAKMLEPPKVEYGAAENSEHSAGKLTSGELNDFRKWELWKDIAEAQLAQYKGDWGITPKNRYTVQLLTLDKMPAVDCPVKLLSGSREIWSGRTDNTGKAELWAGIFDSAYSNSGDYSVEVYYNEQVRRIDGVRGFHNGINTIMIDDYCNPPNNVDIVFAVDATGSMGDEINYLKAELKDIIGRLGKKHTDNNFRLGSVFYRDQGDEYLVRKSDLSVDISKTLDFINAQKADGGGDFPEAVDRALQTALNEISWSDKAAARLMFLILDAPPHKEDSDVRERIRLLTAKAAMLGVRIIPVTCSGIDKSAEYLMRSLALATNGTYVFLTDHSGIGGKHLEPTTDKYDVEMMNDLFIRLIDQFTVVPECVKEQALDKIDFDHNIFNQNEQKITESKDEPADFLKCYPNPTAGELTIEITKNIEELYLTDISGKILERYSAMGIGQHLVNLTNYPTGVFFIKYQIDGKWGHLKVMMVR